MKTSSYLDNEDMAAKDLHKALIAIQTAQGHLMRAQNLTSDTSLTRFCAEFEGTLSLLRGVGNVKLSNLTDFIATERAKQIQKERINSAYPE